MPIDRREFMIASGAAIASTPTAKEAGGKIRAAILETQHGHVRGKLQAMIDSDQPLFRARKPTASGSADLQGASARRSDSEVTRQGDYINRKAISSRTREATLRPCCRAGRNRHCRTASTAFLSSPRPKCRSTSMFLA